MTHPHVPAFGNDPELVSLLLVDGAGSGPWAFDRWSCAPCGVTVDAREFDASTAEVTAAPAG